VKEQESNAIMAFISSLSIDIAGGIAAAFLQFVFAMSYSAGVFASPRSSSLGY
jgi:hypothetical protein